MTLVDTLDDLLPQTQCRQCGFEGCRAYAEALAEAGAAHNRCAPGGAAGIALLAQALGRPVLPLDPAYGREVPFAVARIRAADCIGCGWCTRVCPTDAVVGAPKHLYGIIEADCTGCSLCLAACPMDCIELVENGRTWTLADAHRARTLHQRAKTRRAAQKAEENARLERLRSTTPGGKSTLIADIMAKARAVNAARQTQKKPSSDD